MYLSFDTVFELNSIVESPMGNEAEFVDHAKAIVDNAKIAFDKREIEELKTKLQWVFNDFIETKEYDTSHRDLYKLFWLMDYYLDKEDKSDKVLKNPFTVCLVSLCDESKEYYSARESFTEYKRWSNVGCKAIITTRDDLIVLQGGEHTDYDYVLIYPTPENQRVYERKKDEDLE